MRARIMASIFTLDLVLAASSASAQSDLYNNGPINGDYDAWTINEGFAISDSFTTYPLDRVRLTD